MESVSSPKLVYNYYHLHRLESVSTEAIVSSAVGQPFNFLSSIVLASVYQLLFFNITCQLVLKSVDSDKSVDSRPLPEDPPGEH
jgi:hypothetical protein